MNEAQLKAELQYKTARSSGAGGQHVNKVETKVVLCWSPHTSIAIHEDERRRLLRYFNKRMSKAGVLHIESSSSRSQLQNKTNALNRLLKELHQALIPEKHRIDTRIPRSQILKRLDQKRRQALKKQNRNNRPESDL